MSSYLTNKTFWKATIERTVRTAAQVSIATIGTTAVIHEVDWLIVGSATALASVLSLLTSVASGTSNGHPSLAGESLEAPRAKPHG